MEVAVAEEGLRRMHFSSQMHPDTVPTILGRTEGQDVELLLFKENSLFHFFFFIVLADISFSIYKILLIKGTAQIWEQGDIATMNWVK